MQLESGVVVHTCNPSYVRGRDRKIVVSSHLRQKLVRPYLKSKWDIGMHACSPSYTRDRDRRIAVQASKVNGDPI
jgi:hypothetical protein